MVICPYCNKEPHPESEIEMLIDTKTRIEVIRIECAECKLVFFGVSQVPYTLN